MRNSIIKIISLILIIGLNWAGLSAVIETLAYFGDTETSSENSYTAGTLDFSLTASEWEPEDIASEMVPGDTVNRDISVINDGSLAFQYFVKSEMIAGDEDFCDALQLEVWEDELMYSNGLMDFNLEGSPIVISDGQDDWNFKVTFPVDIPDELQGKSCLFKFVFDGWQDNLEEPGFSDTEEIENILESGYWVSLTSEYSPIADAYINQASGDTNYGSSPALRIRSKNPSNNRSFVRFDFHFPERTNIISSFLRLFMYDPPSASRDYEARRAEGDWKERNPDGITWNNQPSVSSDPTVLISSGATPGWLSWEVTPDVQGFVDSTYSNYGWRLSDTAENSPTNYLAKFRSRESSFADYRPILEVSFTSPEADTAYPVVNEVYYHVGSGMGSDPKNEWVEIYNPTDSDIDISGWKICDRWGCDTIPFSAAIPAKEFGLITKNASTWGYWPDIPPEAVKIVLGSNIGGNGLGNWGDRVILKDSSDVVIDAMSYGSDTSQLDPSVPLSRRGDSLARIVKGYDANLANDWIINATPNPGTNPSEGGLETIRFTSEGVEVASSEEGLESLEQEGLLAEEEILLGEELDNEIILEETTIEENSTTTDVNSTTTEETSTSTENQEEGGIVEEIIEIIDGIIDGIVEEIIPDEPADEPTGSSSNPEIQPSADGPDVQTGEEQTTIEQIPTDDLVIEETPVIEEQSAIAPDNNSGEQTPPTDNNSSGGDSGNDGSSEDSTVSAGGVTQ